MLQRKLFSLALATLFTVTIQAQVKLHIKNGDTHIISYKIDLPAKEGILSSDRTLLEEVNKVPRNPSFTISSDRGKFVSEGIKGNYITQGEWTIIFLWNDKRKSYGCIVRPYDTRD